MGSGHSLTERERGKIDQLVSMGFSQRQIAKEIGRGKTTIQRYLAVRSGKSRADRRGRPRAVSSRTLKQIRRTVRNKVISSRQVQQQLNLAVSKRTVSRYLSSLDGLKLMKMKAAPALTADHQRRRMEFAINHVTWRSEWDKVIFSDEKKFNLDGPDGYHYYWHDVNSKEINFSKRAQGGGGVMIWAAFCKQGKSSLCFINIRMKSDSYCKVLEEHLLPYVSGTLHGNFIFQQDNAPCHRARSTMKWLEEHAISTMEWPALSPDLNPIENLWGILVQRVYLGGRQFSSKVELKEAIERAWVELDNSILCKLIESMQPRMIAVLKANGNAINY